MNNRLKQFKITKDLLPQNLSHEDLLNNATPVDNKDIANVLEHLIPQNCGHELIRIGGARDGGYLVPNDFDGVESCFSPGVNNFKKFEDELASAYGIKSFMCDFTSDPQNFRTPLIEGFQQFEKKWLDVTEGPKNLDINQWVEDNSSNSKDSILQIDIEGAEYRNLLHASEKTLARFRIIVIEFHSLHLLNERSFLRGILGPVLEKLSKQFVCCHVHGNNCCGFTRFNDEWVVPRVLEVTYIRKDRVRATDSKLLIPHPEDDINVRRNPPIHLEGPWLRNADPSKSKLIQLEQSINWLPNQAATSQKLHQPFQNQSNFSHSPNNAYSQRGLIGKFRKILDKLKSLFS